MAKSRASTSDGSTNPFFKAAKEVTAADGDTTLPPSSIFADAAPKETVEGDKEVLHAEEELPEAEPDQAEYWTMRVGSSGNFGLAKERSDWSSHRGFYARLRGCSA